MGEIIEELVWQFFRKNLQTASKNRANAESKVRSMEVGSQVKRQFGQGTSCYK